MKLTVLYEGDVWNWKQFAKGMAIPIITGGTYLGGVHQPRNNRDRVEVVARQAPRKADQGPPKATRATETPQGRPEQPATKQDTPRPDELNNADMQVLQRVHELGGFSLSAGKPIGLRVSIEGLRESLDKLVAAGKLIVNNGIYSDKPQEAHAGPDTKLSKIFGDEIQVISDAARRNNCGGDLYYVLLAIRRAENGAAGREFGVLAPKAKDTNLDTQAGWAAATIVKNHKRWEEAGKPGDFIPFLAKVYCPVGASNDPSGLNVNWVKNVTSWYQQLRG